MTMELPTRFREAFEIALAQSDAFPGVRKLVGDEVIRRTPNVDIAICDEGNAELERLQDHPDSDD